MKALLLTMLMLFSLPAQLHAQDTRLPPGKWWEMPKVVELLHLSQAQQEKINDLVYQHARKMIGLNAEVEKAKLALAQQVDSNSFEASKVRAAFNDFQNARRELENERFEMLLAVRKVLSAEQWQQIGDMKRRLDKLKEGRLGRRPRLDGRNFRPDQRRLGAERPPEARGPRP